VIRISSRPNRLPAYWKLRDDEKLYFGDDEDFGLVYDSSADAFKIHNIDGDEVLSFGYNANKKISLPNENSFVVYAPGRDFNIVSHRWSVTTLAAGRVDCDTGFNVNDFERVKDDNQLRFGTDDDITFEYDSANAKLKVGGADFVDETADGMTANPEADTEDGFLTIEIGTNVYQIPIYLA